jgi:hypothetical protein
LKSHSITWDYHLVRKKTTMPSRRVPNSILFHGTNETCSLLKMKLLRWIQSNHVSSMITSIYQLYWNCLLFSTISRTGKERSQTMCNAVQRTHIQKIDVSKFLRLPMLHIMQSTVGMLNLLHLRRFLVFKWSFSNNKKYLMCFPWQNDF